MICECSILGWESLCLNHRGTEAISLWHYGELQKPRFLLLHVSSWFLGLLPLVFLLIITHRFSKGFQKRDDWPVKHCDGNKTQFGASGNMGRGQVLLEDEICISMQILSRRHHKVL